MISRRHSIERFADFDIAQVRSNHEAGVGEGLNLRLDSFNNALCTISYVDYGDTRPHIDDGVSIDIDDNSATCSFNNYRNGESKGT